MPEELKTKTGKGVDVYGQEKNIDRLLGFAKTEGNRGLKKKSWQSAMKRRSRKNRNAC